jgi:anti-anti-sigma factor
LNVRAVGRHSWALRGVLADGGAPPARRDDSAAWLGDGEGDLVSRDTLPQSRTNPADRAFYVETGAEEHCGVITPVGEFDSSALGPFEEALTELMGDERPILIDLSRLTFIDSSGLWAITLTQRICRRRGLGLLIKPGPERVQSVFEVTGLADLLPFTSSALRASEAL